MNSPPPSFRQQHRDSPWLSSEIFFFWSKFKCSKRNSFTCVYLAFPRARCASKKQHQHEDLQSSVLHSFMITIQKTSSLSWSHGWCTSVHLVFLLTHDIKDIFCFGFAHLSDTLLYLLFSVYIPCKVRCSEKHVLKQDTIAFDLLP